MGCKNMFCYYRCVCIIVAVLQCIESIRGAFVQSKAPLDLNCFHGISIPPALTIDTTYSRNDERKVLRQFYLETGGTNWTIQHGWSSYNTSDMTSDIIHHCNWSGVTCKDRYVIGLKLNLNNLSGRVPGFLWRLRNLMVLCLPSNALHGELKYFIFPNMTKLLRIDLSFCHLSGNLPQSIFANLKSLEKIQLCCQQSLSKMEDSIPQSIVNLKNLRVLSLGENRLSGAIPRDIGKLNKVWFLDLEFMPGLSGNISWFLGMKSLQRMHLSEAGIYGEIPHDLGSYFPSMTELQLRNNPGINGAISTTNIDKMTNLTKIVLCGNSLGGTIPRQLGYLPKLRILDLSNNHFQELDSELSFKGSPNLEIFLLGNNGEISTSFSQLLTALLPNDGQPSALRILNVSNCNFNGYIDRSIWGLSNLIELDLKHNNIGGHLPEVHNDMMFLTNLDLSHNQFEGAIPNNFKLLQSLMFMDIRGNPKLSSPASKVNITSGFIQDVMRISQYYRQKDVNYSCPFATLASTNGSVLLDPSYYGYKFCVCGEGFYGSLANCKECMTGGVCSGEPIEDNKIFMTIKRGYWPSPSPHNASHLVPCPSLPSDKDWACNPSGECKCWVNISDDSLPIVCDSACICHAGSTGRLCSMCHGNYYKSGSLCKKCPTDPSFSVSSLIPIAVICLVVMWIVLYFCDKSASARFIVVVVELAFLLIMRLVKVISGWFVEISLVVMFFYIAGVKNNTRGIISILVFYIQVLDAMISANIDPYPDFVVSIQHYMSSIMNLDFTGISCKVPWLFTPLGNYLLIFLFPIGCLLLIWGYYSLRVFLARICSNCRVQEHQSLLDTRCLCLKVSITCLCLTFFPVIKQTIAVLAPCQHDENYAYMSIAPWVECSDEDPIYPSLQFFGWLGIVIYGIVVPLVLLGLLLWYKMNENDFTEDNQKLCDSWLGGIYLPYVDSVQWYFEILKLIRKFLIALFLAVFPHTSCVQTYTVSIILMLALIYQVKFEPYKVYDDRVAFENILEVLTLAVLQQSFIMLRFASYDVEASLGILWTVIAFNVVVVLCFMVALPAVLINTCCAHGDNDTPREHTQPSKSKAAESAPLLQGRN